MNAIQWVTVRTALQSWIATKSGVAGNKVIWHGQCDANGTALPRPSGMYIELKLTLLAWNGFSDARVYSYDAGTNTLTQSVVGPRTALFTATCYQGAPTGGNETDASAAMAVINDAMTACGLDDVTDSLVAAGIGVGSIDTIPVDGSIINNVRFESRAIATVKINLASSISFTYPVGQGWIEFVNASGVSPGDLAGVAIHVGS